MNRNQELLEAIAYPLPEDVEKLKWAGYFDECLALIRQKYEENLPNALRRKLEMEEIQIARMRRDYVVSEEEAQAVFAEKIRDWRPEELDALRRENLVDWAFVAGKIHYIDTFFDNLIKISDEYRLRQRTPAAEEARSEAEIRREVIREMQAQGGAVRTMRLRAGISAEVPEDRLEDELEFWLPLPVEGYQMRNVRLEEMSPAYGIIAPADAAQRTVCFRGPARTLRQAKIVYSLENHIRYISPDPAQVSPRQPEGYLSEELPHIQFTPYLRRLTAEVTGAETNPLNKARKIYDFITQNVRYSYMRGYLALPVIPEYCAARLRGDCGVQALLFITMCRIAGVPARWQSGLYVNENGAGSHDWAMFYVAPFGWMFTDCSFGGSAWREGDLERWNFYFCNLDPYRVVLATEFQQEFVPAPAFLRADPYDNQQGEAGLGGQPLPHGLWRSSTELLSLEQGRYGSKNA